MSRNIVPRANKDADLGTPEKNWNKLYADAVILRGNDLKTSLDGKTNLNTLTNKGDLYVATGPGEVVRLPRGADAYVLKSNSADPKGLMWGPVGARQELTDNMTVTVGDGGDFSTINSALANIVSLYYPKYISAFVRPRVTINLLPGFVMSEQVIVESLDLSWITITGTDDETIINRSALTIWAESVIPAFAALNGGFLPIIDQLFNMDTTGDASNKDGIFVSNNSNAIIWPNKGIKNSGQSNIHASNNSNIIAYGAIASGAGTHGIYAYSSSNITAQVANASGCGFRGIYADNVSRINANDANASGAGVNGVMSSNGSIVEASNINATESGQWGILVYEGGIIHATNASGSINVTPNTITSSGIVFKTE